MKLFFVSKSPSYFTYLFYPMKSSHTWVRTPQDPIEFIIQKSQYFSLIKLHYHWAEEVNYNKTKITIAFSNTYFSTIFYINPATPSQTCVLLAIHCLGFLVCLFCYFIICLSNFRVNPILFILRSILNIAVDWI